VWIEPFLFVFTVCKQAFRKVQYQRLWKNVNKAQRAVCDLCHGEFAFFFIGSNLIEHL